MNVGKRKKMLDRVSFLYISNVILVHGDTKNRTFKY